MIPEKTAYHIAKKCIHRHWKDTTQIHLSKVGEKADSWLFVFVPFVPNKNLKDYYTVSHVVFHGIEGCIPVYYGCSMPGILVEKTTGISNKICFTAENLLARDENNLYLQFKFRDAQIFFKNLKMNKRHEPAVSGK